MVRERGVDATSVADVMEAAGMTNGGFYRHFQSKDEMIAMASALHSPEFFSPSVPRSPLIKTSAHYSVSLSKPESGGILRNWRVESVSWGV
jgi:hypothetical protein